MALGDKGPGRWSGWALFCILVCGMTCPAAGGDNVWTSSGPAATVNALLEGDDGTLWAGAVDGLYRRGQAQETWQEVVGLLAGANVLALAQGQRLYAGANFGLFASADGQQWEPVEGVGAGILAVAARDGQVWVGTFGRGVFASADGGASWSAGSGLEETIVFSIETAVQDAATVYAGTARGPYVSRDGGQTWAPLGSGLQGVSIRQIYADPLDAGVLWLATFGAGVQRSSDGGQSWQERNTGLPELNVRGLAFEPAGQDVYAATSTSGFYRSRDGGASWAPFNEGLQQLAARQVQVLAAGQQVLGAGTGPGVWQISLQPQPRLEAPLAPVDFGRVRVGDSGTAVWQVTNGGAGLLVVDRIEAGGDFVVQPETVEVPAGQSAAVQLVFVPGQRGPASDSLTVHSNDPNQPVVRLALSGTGTEAELSVAPASIAFGSVRLGEFRDTTVVLTNNGNAPLTLRNALVEGPAMRVLQFEAQTLEPGQSGAVALRFLPLRTGGVSDQLVVVSDAPERPRLAVTLDGAGVAPQLTVGPLSLDYGSVDLGQSKQLSVELSNSGNIDLRIERFELGGEAFRLDTATPLVLAPGQVHSLSIDFVPLVSGLHADTMRVVSDAPGPQGSLSVALRGSGGALALKTEDLLPVGPGPVDLLVADLDGDGTADLAVADSAAGTVQVWLNDGAGSYPERLKTEYPNAASPYGGWDEPVALGAAPIAGQIADLVVADRVGQTVSILRNDGSGGFDTERTDIFIGRSIEDLWAADLDADGDADIAVADGSSPTLTLLYNNGSGTFNARITSAVEDHPVALRAGQLDADGHPDLAVANRGAGTVSILLNDRQGGFLPRRDFVVGIEPVALRLVDHDADGDNDLLVVNAGSRDIALLENDGDGVLRLVRRVATGMPPADLALSDLSVDAFVDLVVAGAGAPHVAFWENDAGQAFLGKDVLTASTTARRVEIFDADRDGDNDLAVLSTQGQSVQLYSNSDTRRLDPPRAPTQVRAEDLPRDLGRRIEVTWAAPQIDEQIGRTVEYGIFRAFERDGDFVEIGRAAAGQRRFVDAAATLADTFFYYVTAANARIASPPSDTVFAASRPAPFFELELVNEPRLSVGDTLKVRAFLTPAGHALAGASLYLSFADSALVLLAADSTGANPFRPEPTLGPVSLLENRLQPLMPNKINVSLGELNLQPGVEPVALGEIWFRTLKDTVTTISIDDEAALNRRSAVVEAISGEWVQPFIPPRPTQVEIRDFKVTGQIQLQGRSDSTRGVQVSFTFIDSNGVALQSPLNDENRFRPGIQYTLDADGSFALAQIPRGRYRVLAKPPNHLQGLDDSVAVGDSLSTVLQFAWVGADSSRSNLLPAGDGNGDNQVNLADFGLFVRYLGVSRAQAVVWGRAQVVDFNGDGAISADDFFLLSQNFGRVGLGFAPAAKRIRVEGQLADGVLSVERPVEGFALRLRDGVPWQAWGDWVVRSWLVGDERLVVGALPEGQARAQEVLRLKEADGIVQFRVLTSENQVQEVRLAASQLPAQTRLLANFPNPFNPQTVIPFDLAEVGPVELAIFDVLGQKLRTLVDEPLGPGRYHLAWDGRDGQGRAVASGMYLYRLKTAEGIQSRRLLLLH